VAPTWEIVSLVGTAGNAVKPSCSVTLRRADGKIFKTAEFGGGPVDAMFHALSKLTGVELRVTDYQVHSVTVGNDALGEVTVQVQQDDHSFRARAVSTDIVTATAEAFVNVVNRIAGIREQRVEEPIHAQA
jgi:2-isopropylmalate synthase